MSPATGSPRFTDQSATPEGWFVGAEKMKDFFNDFDGHINRVSFVLVRSGNLRAGGND